VAQAVREHLPSKLKALISNPKAAKKNSNKYKTKEHYRESRRGSRNQY
jgi:hypothetical protein